MHVYIHTYIHVCICIHACVLHTSVFSYTDSCIYTIYTRILSHLQDDFWRVVSRHFLGICYDIYCMNIRVFIPYIHVVYLYNTYTLCIYTIHTRVFIQNIQVYFHMYRMIFGALCPAISWLSQQCGICCNIYCINTILVYLYNIYT